LSTSSGVNGFGATTIAGGTKAIAFGTGSFSTVVDGGATFLVVWQPMSENNKKNNQRREYLYKTKQPYNPKRGHYSLKIRVEAITQN